MFAVANRPAASPHQIRKAALKQTQVRRSARRAAIAAAGAVAVQRYDWAHVAQDVLAVYETVTVEPVRVTEDVRSNRLARLVGFGGS